MREFKFRGVSSDTNKIIYGYGAIIAEDKSFVVMHQCNRMCHLSSVIHGSIMQFTGENDCNNINIYESDIVRCYIDGEEIGALDVIEFKHGAFILRHRNVSLLEWNSMPNDAYSSELKVIGNIYENPELLK